MIDEKYVEQTPKYVEQTPKKKGHKKLLIISIVVLFAFIVLGISALAAGGSSTDTTKPQQTTTAPAPKQQTPQPQPVTPKPVHILTDAEAQSIAQQYLVNETVEYVHVHAINGQATIVLGIAEDDASIGHTSSVMYLVASGFENHNVHDIAFAFGDNNNNGKYLSSVTFTSPTEYTATQPQPIS